METALPTGVPEMYFTENQYFTNYIVLKWDTENSALAKSRYEISEVIADLNKERGKIQ